jgi:hypothetical protein
MFFLFPIDGKKHDTRVPVGTLPWLLYPRYYGLLEAALCERLWARLPLTWRRKAAHLAVKFLVACGDDEGPGKHYFTNDRRLWPSDVSQLARSLAPHAIPMERTHLLDVASLPAPMRARLDGHLDDALGMLWCTHVVPSIHVIVQVSGVLALGAAGVAWAVSRGHIRGAELAWTSTYVSAVGLCVGYVWLPTTCEEIEPPKDGCLDTPAHAVMHLAEIALVFRLVTVVATLVALSVASIGGLVIVARQP